MRTEKRYPSKVDWWLALLLVLMALWGVWNLIYGIIKLGEAPSMAWIMIGTGVFIGLMFGLMIWPIHYTLNSKELVIRFGIFKMRLKLETITGVVLSSNPLSAPAFSLARLKISHSGWMKMALISPPDREAFMEDLASRCAHLEYEGGEVRPVSASDAGASDSD